MFIGPVIHTTIISIIERHVVKKYLVYTSISETFDFFNSPSGI